MLLCLFIILIYIANHLRHIVYEMTLVVYNNENNIISKHHRNFKITNTKIIKTCIKINKTHSWGKYNTHYRHCCTTLLNPLTQTIFLRSFDRPSELRSVGWCTTGQVAWQKRLFSWASPDDNYWQSISLLQDLIGAVIRKVKQPNPSTNSIPCHVGLYQSLPAPWTEPRS